MSEMLSKDAIIAVQDTKIERVEVPEWGGHVYVRGLTARERDEFETSTVKMNKKGQREDNLENFRARFVSLVMVDDKGARLFTNRAEVSMLGNKSAAALQRVFNKGQELNGMSDDDVDSLTSDFDQAPEEDSTSD